MVGDQHLGEVPRLEADDRRTRLVFEAPEPQRTDAKTRTPGSRLLLERRHTSTLRLLAGGFGCGGKGARAAGVPTGARDER